MRVSWYTHLVGLVDADTIPARTPSITPALHRFLETKLLFWLEVLSVLGVVRNGVEALRGLVRGVSSSYDQYLSKVTQTKCRSHQHSTSPTTVFVS